MGSVRDSGGETRTELKELAVVFLKLGTIAFGGPAAHIAMMDHEIVRRRKWLTREEFLDLLGATNLIPGPNSTEMAIHIGYRRGGWRGLVVAGSCFILPAALMVTVIAWSYVRFGKLPQVEGILYAVKPVVIAVVAQALWALSRSAIKTWTLALAGVVVVALNFAGINELLLLFATGVAICVLSGFVDKKQIGMRQILWWFSPAMNGAALTIATETTAFGLWPLFGFFLKVGSVLFGSGYVLLAFLRADLVERWHWLTESQLIDAIAVGQVTPGPVFTTATFIGYFLGGLPGALVATLGIFLPAFLFVAISGPLVPRMRQSPVVAAFLDGVVVASMGLMTVVTWQLAGSALVDPLTLLLAALSGLLLIRFKINSVWLVLGGAVIGLIISVK
ncbi:MAG TPA: chromate efflux transporter [Candidatus Udaeobacter sp.]|jgi:chromate transporter|nr:chromate efflux transporter [Candidatus Udaeobacter sp.]